MWRGNKEKSTGTEEVRDYYLGAHGEAWVKHPQSYLLLFLGLTESNFPGHYWIRAVSVC